MISNKVKSLAERARAKKLKPSESRGRQLLDLQSGHVRHQGLHRRRSTRRNRAILAVGAGEKRAIVGVGEQA